MVSAARVVGNMVRIAGATLGDPFFTKEIDQALQMLEGEFGRGSQPCASLSVVYHVSSEVLNDQTLDKK